MPERNSAAATVSPSSASTGSPSSEILGNRGSFERSENEMPALLPPRVDGEGSLYLSHAHVPAFADGGGAEFLPLQRRIGAVVLLEHSRERPPRARELAVVARPDAGRQ